MNDDVRNIVLGVLATGISAALGWFTRTYLWRRRLRRKQAFFGLPDNSESLLVVNRDAGGTDLAEGGQLPGVRAGRGGAGGGRDAGGAVAPPGGGGTVRPSMIVTFT